MKALAFRPLSLRPCFLSNKICMSLKPNLQYLIRLVSTTLSNQQITQLCDYYILTHSIIT